MRVDQCDAELCSTNEKMEGCTNPNLVQFSASDEFSPVYCVSMCSGVSVGITISPWYCSLLDLLREIQHKSSKMFRFVWKDLSRKICENLIIL